MVTPNVIPPDRIDPVLDLLNIRPPQSWAWTFDSGSAKDEPTRAVALCMAAILTYSPSTEVTSVLKQWHFHNHEILRGFSTQGFVAQRDDVIIVALRGTEPINADDWLSDVQYHHRSLFQPPLIALGLPPGIPPRLVTGAVHRGFAHALEEIIDPLVRAVQTFAQSGASRVFLTGHSLGGALAVLTAAVLKLGLNLPVAGVYTYGQPRVGDHVFSKTYNAVLGTVTFRYVNDLDIVPHLPPAQLPRALVIHQRPSAATLLRSIHKVPGQIAKGITSLIQGERFDHVGQLRLFLPDGTLTQDERSWQAREVIYSGTLTQLFRDSPSLIRAGLRKMLFADRRILHHDPLNGYLPKLMQQIRQPHA